MSETPDHAPNDVTTHYVHLGNRTVCGEQRAEVPCTTDVSCVTCRKWLQLKGIVTATNTAADCCATCGEHPCTHHQCLIKDGRCLIAADHGQAATS